MSGWLDSSLEEIASADRYSIVGGPFGSALGRKDYVDAGVPVIRGGQLAGPGPFSHDDLVFVTDEKAEKHKGNLAYPGDILVTQRGTVGQVGRIPDSAPHERYLLSQSQMKLTVDSAVANPRFVYYWLLSPTAQNAIVGLTISAGVPHINLATFKGLRLRLPPMREQQSIAHVLGTLDDLIANNRRRVEVLEEMARAIYREWFVHFRYPGHDNATLNDAPPGPIPKGWETRRIGDVLDLRYGKGLRKDNRRDGPVAVVGSSGVVGWHDEGFVGGPSIIVGRKGNVGSITWVDGESWPIDTTYFVDTDLPLRYVAEQLRNTEFFSTHAAVPGLSRDVAYSKPFLLPAAPVMERYAVVSETLNTEATLLTSMSQRLASIRDLVLPRLVSGEIDLSTLNLDDLVDESLA